MSLTQSEWTDESANGMMVITCTVLSGASDTDAYTLKTPARTVDGSRPFTVYHSATATPFGSALPVDVWIGYDDNFALSGQGASVVATSGGFYKEINDEGQAAINTAGSQLEYSYLIDCNLGEADVVTVSAIASGYKVNVPAAPYYVFNLNAATALNEVTTTWKIVQKQ